MHPISSREETWFSRLYWTDRPTFHKHLKRSLPSAIGMWEGPWVCCLKWRGYQESQSRNMVGFPWSGLNVGSSSISQDEGMSESSVETIEKTLVPPLIWIGGLTSLDNLRGSWSSMLPKVMRSDSSWKLIGIPISLWKLERDAWYLTSPLEASVLFYQA